MINTLSKKTFTFFICLNLFVLTFCASALSINAQPDVGRVVAKVSNGAGNPRNIKYSDLLLQLALQPDTPLDPPKIDDLKRSLQSLIYQSLIGFEVGAFRSLYYDITEAEIDLEIKRVVGNFRTATEFEKRLQTIGFDSIKDENFRREMHIRTAIEKILDFRFRSFVIITREEEEKYYLKVFAPEFRRKNPGILIWDDFDKKVPQIRTALIEEKADMEIKRFLDNAKKRATITIFSDELK
jgi:hypothetical protein